MRYFRAYLNTVASQIDAMDAAKTVYPGELVYYMLTPNKALAVRLRDVNLESQTCTLETTATKDKAFPRGTMFRDIPFSMVCKRTRWDHPRFSLRWLDYPSAKERAGSEFVRLTALINRQAWNK